MHFYILCIYKRFLGIKIACKATTINISLQNKLGNIRGQKFYVVFIIKNKTFVFTEGLVCIKRMYLYMGLFSLNLVH